MHGIREHHGAMRYSSNSVVEGVHSMRASETEKSQHVSVIFETSASAKQKRKRTSPQDHATLEAAYQENSKPDKEERAKLVQQTELGEKEVQIWFQNRRQNDRRKSKPLLPHELIPHFRNGVPTEVTKQLTSSENVHRHLDSQIHESSTSSPTDGARPASRASSIQNLLNPTPSSQEVSPVDLPTTLQHKSFLTPPSSFESTASTSGAQSSGNVSFTAQHNVHTCDESALSRKRSHEEMSEVDRRQEEASEPQEHSSKLQRSSSFVRLAVNADGSFKVRTDSEPTPSPPKQQPTAPPSHSTHERGLTRSQSAVESSLNFRDINPPIKRVPGRSRDARTWEFYCDKGAREALASQAEEQEHGSAINAINIMRSGKTVALSPNPGKHNKSGNNAKRRGKPAFSRAQSSMARLQSSATHPKEQKSSGKPHVRSSSGSESDKENWLPGTRDSQNVMRRMHPSAPRNTILQEHQIITTSQQVHGSENRRESQESLVIAEKAKGDDLDCIQGLLSLSQGAWR